MAERSAQTHDAALDALEALDEGVMVIDPKRRVAYANEAASRLLGRGALSAVAAGEADRHGFFRPDERTPWPAGELPHVKALSGEARGETAMFYAPTGKHLVVTARPRRGEGGEARGATLVVRDVSEQRREELRLRESERQLRAILDNIPDIAWLKDRDCRFVTVNRRLVEALGKTSVAELVGRNDFDFSPRELAERYQAGDLETMRSGKQCVFEEQHLDARGVVSWIETVKMPLFDEQGRVVGTAGIARDISERKRAEEVLRTLNDELERRVAERTRALLEAQDALVRKERLALLGQLAGGVAHQIRNPLAAILNATYVLDRNPPADIATEAVQIIREEVAHANATITGLLGAARMQPPDRRPVSMVALVERVLGSEAVTPGVKVERAFGEVPMLELDADQIYGALFNLVRNAVEAMNGKGVLRAELRADEGEVVVAFVDTGTGVLPEMRSHLFEPLHSTKPSGVGLGLVTARTFVEAHRGRIVSVDVPSGARFEVHLPRG